jgi:hypothetical protein
VGGLLEQPFFCAPSFVCASSVCAVSHDRVPLGSS